MSALNMRSGDELGQAAIDEIPSRHTATHPLNMRHLLVGTHQDLRIKGRWFERAGFSIGTRVRVLVFKKRLIIDVVQEPLQISPRQYRGHPAL